MYPIILAQASASVTWTSAAVISHVGLGFFLGAVGQAARMIVGLKKTNDEARASGAPFKDHFDASQLFVSLIIGGVAGSLASLALFDSMDKLTKEIVLGLIGAGYAGADFIEGFMRSEAKPPAPVAAPAVIAVPAPVAAPSPAAGTVVSGAAAPAVTPPNPPK